MGFTPPTRTALASVGQPAKSPAAKSTRLKTWAVVGRRDARTTEALSADVRDSDDERLLGQRLQDSGTHLFSSTGSSLAPTLLLRRRRCRLSRARFRASGPVVKSARRRWIKNRPPASGQIESDVVAEVSVPRTGERSDRRSGGSTRGRTVDAAGNNAACQFIGSHFSNSRPGGGGLRPHPTRYSAYANSPVAAQLHPTCAGPKSPTSMT